jgi:hypothetical protein
MWNRVKRWRMVEDYNIIEFLIQHILITNERF